jgi:hypothetical protein
LAIHHHILKTKILYFFVFLLEAAVLFRWQNVATWQQTKKWDCDLYKGFLQRKQKKAQNSPFL